MSKYYKAEDIIRAIEEMQDGYNGWSDRFDKAQIIGVLDDLPTIEVSEGNQVLYGTEHDCELTMFGECSYNETGCGSCAVAEKIRRALSVEVSEDCISRAEVLAEFKKDYDDIVDLMTAIEEFPSVVPKPKEGEWKFKKIFPNDDSEFPMGYLVCSVCGSQHANATPCNYCDNCGAKLKGADDES